MPTLVLLRHGESAWNASNRFTGWVDVPLTAIGEDQARHAGALLCETGLQPATVHTSVLSRAERTAALVLEAAAGAPVEVHRTWRLNERCYGALQGKDRVEVCAEHGEEQYLRWRRSYDGAPPPLPPGPRGDTGDELAPRTESLADVAARLLPYWHGRVVPLLAAGPALVVAHGNSLRALVAHLDALTPDEVLGLDIPTGMPLRYELGPDLVPQVRGGCYLEPTAAAVAAAVVARQGRPRR